MTLLMAARKHKPNLTERIRRIPPCSQCRPHDGLWRMGEDGRLERCGCDRGFLLKIAERSGCKRGVLKHLAVKQGALRLRDEKGNSAVLPETVREP